MELEGFLFDLYCLDSSMILWIKEEGGSLRRLEDPFRPRFYAKGKKEDLRTLWDFLERGRWATGHSWTRKREFWTGDEVEVLEIEVADGRRYTQLVKILGPWEEGIRFYDCDIPLAQLYLYEKGLFPTGRCLIECEGTRLFEIHSDPAESVWSDVGETPDLRIMELRLDDRRTFSHRGRPRSLLIECEGYEIEMEEMDLKEMGRLLRSFDPDVILTEDGDSCLMPFFFAMEHKSKIALPWDREPHGPKRSLRTQGRSYWSYGRTYYQAAAYPLFGRWHIDRRNSFLFKESALEGILELARLAQIPVQRMARTSPGTAITSMQLARAFHEGILIPWRKGEPERFKTAWDLLVADKGGLVFQPKLGLFEHVAEIDFASMYPTMMALHNISPETVLCGCCENQKVPEVGYTICEKREGLVPKVLRPLLKRRTWLKSMAKRSEKGEIYHRKQTALKWMLVTCFGYLGYRNARFGRIEAHEAVTAFGREKLLQAKEICEEAGFELLHALTDSLWIRKEGTTEEEVLTLCEKISEATGVVMNLEGLYRWIAFLPSKGNVESPVANRYFGLFRDGKIKARGLSFRRSDTPPLVGEAQLRMLDLLAKADGKEAFSSKIPEILELLLEHSLLLQEGRVKPEDLAITKRISQEANAYKVDSLTALAAQQMEDFGVSVHPGEKVRYIIRAPQSRVKEERVRPFPFVGPGDTYDVKTYQRLLLKATEELLIPVGYDQKRIEAFLKRALGEGGVSSSRRGPTPRRPSSQGPPVASP